MTFEDFMFDLMFGEEKPIVKKCEEKKSDDSKQALIKSLEERVVKTDELNSKLTRRNKELEREIDRLRAKNAELERDKKPCLDIKSITISEDKKGTMVAFTDNTYATAFVRDDETFDLFTGVAMCLLRKAMGNNFVHKINSAIDSKLDKTSYFTSLDNKGKSGEIHRLDFGKEMEKIKEEESKKKKKEELKKILESLVQEYLSKSIEENVEKNKKGAEKNV